MLLSTTLTHATSLNDALASSILGFILGLIIGISVSYMIWGRGHG